MLTLFLESSRIYEETLTNHIDIFPVFLYCFLPIGAKLKSWIIFWPIGVKLTSSAYLNWRINRSRNRKVILIHWISSTIILNLKVSNWNLRISEYGWPPGRAKVTLAITKALKVQINFEPQIRRQNFKDHSCFYFTMYAYLNG